jgi:hypothetical protein
MKSGYHQTEIEEKHKEKTEFTVGPLGFYKFNEMSSRLSNVPATYHSRGFTSQNILYLFGRLIIFSKTFEEHMDRLRRIFNRVWNFGLKLPPKKFSFMMRHVKYIRHVVSEDWVETDPEKVSQDKDWPTAKDSEDVRSFLGFMGYYRKFIKNFAKIARPD